MLVKIIVFVVWSVFIYLVGANNPLSSVKKKIVDSVNKL